MSQITILCIDEYELMLLTMQHMLEHEGWRVDAFRNGARALEHLASGARYDAIIINEELRGLSGLEILERVRGLAHCRQTPVIMFASTASEAQARLLGVDALLQKPNDIRYLTEVVARCLRRPVSNERDEPPPPSNEKHSATILRLAKPRAGGKEALSLPSAVWSVQSDGIARKLIAAKYDRIRSFT